MKITLTRAQADQLLAYVNHRDNGADCGWYYGNKEQFERRHSQILITLLSALSDPSPAAPHEQPKEG